MSHPYADQPPKAFWKKSISDKSFFDLSDLYEAKFAIGHEAKIASGGSCFAQHIGRHLGRSGFNYLDYEPAPAFLKPDIRHLYGYSMYSARYGNIYTTRQLVQLLERALGLREPEESFWHSGGRYYDPYRPTIEPNGFKDLDELNASREAHLSAVKKLFTDCDVFVFTMGLTETWYNKEDGMAYPICPGTAAGSFDGTKYGFLNLKVFEMMQDMRQFFGLVRSVNPKCKFILTVSPVPLTATATDKHVLVATNYSKSALRAVAGQLSDMFDYVDYFPSYEVISSHPGRGMFFDPNMRTVNKRGVSFVMEHFFAAHPPGENDGAAADQIAPDEDEILCDEEILEKI